MAEAVNGSSVCIDNIGPLGRRRRQQFGAALLAVGALAATLLLVERVRWFWCVPLFIPFWIGALGVFQAAGHT